MSRTPTFDGKRHIVTSVVFDCLKHNKNWCIDETTVLTIRKNRGVFFKTCCMDSSAS